MKLNSKSEWFILESPIGESNIKWKEDTYMIERVLNSDGRIVWYGQGTNWVKELNKNWTYLVGNDFIECPEPIYETLYKNLKQ